MTIKYKGCHFEHTAAATVLPRLQSGFTTHAADAPNANEAATNNGVTIPRRALDSTTCPLMHSERNSRLAAATRHEQQMTAMADAANAQFCSRIHAAEVCKSGGWRKEFSKKKRRRRRRYRAARRVASEAPIRNLTQCDMSMSL